MTTCCIHRHLCFLHVICALVLAFFTYECSAGQFYSFAMAESDHTGASTSRDKTKGALAENGLMQRRSTEKSAEQSEVLKLCRFIFGDAAEPKPVASLLTDGEFSKLAVAERTCRPLMAMDNAVQKMSDSLTKHAKNRNLISFRIAKVIRNVQLLLKRVVEAQ